MIYSNIVWNSLIREIQAIDRRNYQPYHDSCHKRVWEKHVYPYYDISYRTYLRYLKVQLPEEDE